MRDLNNLSQRIDRAQRVGDMRDGQQFRARSQQLGQLVHHQLAAVVDGNNPQLGALFLAKHLPGNDVGVMLHGRDEHFVAGAHVFAAIGLRDQVDAFRGAAHEDDLALIAAFRNAALSRRAASCSSVACSERKCTPR